MKVVKKLLRFLVKNYFITIFLGVIISIFLFISYRNIFSKPTYLYAKIKMNQGSWWASTQRPSLWFINSLKKELKDKKINKNSNIELLSVTYYPWYGTSQYDVFLVVKLTVSKLKNSDSYSYQRSTIGVGGPIDIELTNNQFSGTIIEISKKPIVNKYVEKTVYLQKYYAYRWESESINIGDRFNNGEENILEIIDKQIIEGTTLFTNPVGNEVRDRLIIKVKMKLKLIENKYVFGEEQLLVPGQTISLTTKDFIYEDFKVFKIE